MAWLLDTNVISELRKPQAERNVVEFVSSAPLAELYVSIVSLAEIRYGIELSPDPQKRTALQQWLTFNVRPMFSPQRTLPMTEEILLKWRSLMEEGRKTGHILAARSDDRGHRRPSWPHGCDAGCHPIRKGPRAGFQSLELKT